MRQIAENAGVEGSIVVGKMLDKKDANYGYNAATDKFEDLVKAGVIDPVKVVRRPRSHERIKHDPACCGLYQRCASSIGNGAGCGFFHSCGICQTQPAAFAFFASLNLGLQIR